jgi:hypothetical protein
MHGLDESRKEPKEKERLTRWLKNIHSSKESDLDALQTKKFLTETQLIELVFIYQLFEEAVNP